MIGSTKARLLGMLAAFALAATAVLAATAAPASAATTTCQDEILAPGTYGAVVVPADSYCIGEAGITIGGGVTVHDGGTFALGFEESPGPLSSIFGGVTATNPANVQIHFTTIIGGINIQGGIGPFGGPFGITWNAIEDSKIIGTTTINGYDGFWMGFIRNHTIGSVNMTNNVLFDEDGNEYVSNSIHGNLNCSGNDPAPQVGDSEGGPNLVYGFETGQCFGL